MASKPQTASIAPPKIGSSSHPPINAIENLLSTEYSVFQHSEGGYLVRAPKWSLPQHLHDHITAIQPTTSFFLPGKLGRTFKEVLDISSAPYTER
jgi:tripeptidyl-peptidase-1